MFGKVICIDMGSSYTKIAVRKHENEPTEPLGEAGSADTIPMLIPSMIATIERKEGLRYVFGSTAAAQRGGSGIRRFHNWKATLFTPDTSVDPKLGHVEAVGLAVRFLSFIREDILAPRQLDQFPVRLCAPEVEGSVMTPELLRKILLDAGMNVDGTRLVVDEPSANALGVLTRGRNAVWTPPRQSYIPPSPKEMAMQKMFEPQLSSRYMQNGREGTDGHYSVLITDLGAYTTDFALLTFETGFGENDYRRPAIVQESQPIGVSQLDRAVFESCSKGAQKAIAATSQVEWEQKKIGLYAGEEVALSLEGSGVIRIGAGAERRAIDANIVAHADRVILAKRTFLNRHGVTHVNQEIFSGGGASIEEIRVRLRKAASANTISDLLDPEEPASSVMLGKAPLTAREREIRHLENLRLARIGSALGGASVFFG